MRFFGRQAIPLFALIVAGAARCLAAASPLTPAAERPPAPAFSLENASGRPVSLDGYRGEVVVLHFWSTECHACKTELPWFVQFEKRYGSRGLTVVGASTDAEGWPKVRPFLAKKPLHFPVVIADESLTRAYGLQSVPMTVLIDRQGRVAATYRGGIDRAACDRAIQALLLESAGP